MAAIIGALRAVLSLESAAFEKGLSEAQRNFSRFSRQMEQVGERMQGLGTMLTAAVTGPLVGLSVAVSKSVDSLSELDNQARVAGLTAERFKVLSMAADQFGVGQEKLGDVLKDTTDKVGEFLSTGGGEMADFFENIAPKVGITAEAFRGLSGADALQLYVSSLEKAGLSQAEMVFYMEAIADEGSRLLPMFAKNGAAIAAMEAEAKRLGLAIDGDLIAGAREASREFKIVKEVLGTQLQQAMVRLAPAMQEAMRVIVPLIEDLSKWIASVGEAFSKLDPDTQGFIVGAAGLAAAVGPALVGFGLMVSALGAIGAGLMAISLPAILVAGAIGLVAYGAYLIYENWDGITAWFADKWESLKAGISEKWGQIKELFLTYNPVSLIYNNWDGITAWFGDLWGRLREGVSAGWTLIRDTFVTYNPASLIYNNWDGITAWFGELWGRVRLGMSAGWELIRETILAYHPAVLIYENWDGITAWFGTLWPQVRDTFIAGWELIRAEVAQWGERFMQFGRDIVDGLKAGIMEKWDAMVGWFKEKADALAADFASWFGIQSPSRVMREMGGFITQGLQLGLQDGLPGVRNAMISVSDAIQGPAQSMTSAFEHMGGVGQDIFKGLVKGSMTVSQALDRIADRMLDLAIDDLFGALSGGLGGGKAAGKGGGLFGGILQGLGSFLGFADGGVIDAGRVQAFAKGGVVDGATAFAMRGGLGVMGEAGPEAIMPLTRDSAGRLGVRADGAFGGVQVSMPITIDARGAQVGVAEQIAQKVQELRPTMEQWALSAVGKARQRGGLA